MKNPKHNIIFEGAELAGKSWLMSQVYNILESKYNSGGQALDGCHWFNCDVGVYGTEQGPLVVEKYVEIAEALAERNVMMEKLHLAEAVYQKLYRNKEWDYAKIEDRLAKLNTKIVMVTFLEDEKLLAGRLQDRLNLYPHYAKIAQPPADYIRQQQMYLELLDKSKLQYRIFNTTNLPDDNVSREILNFLEE